MKPAQRFFDPRSNRTSSRGNVLDGNVGTKVLWRAPNLPISANSIGMHLNLGDACHLLDELNRLLLTAEDAIAKTLHYGIRFQIRQMSFGRFPRNGMPIKLDVLPVWDSGDWVKFDAIAASDSTPSWLQTQITDAKQVLNDQPPFLISIDPCENDTAGVVETIDGSDTTYRLSNTRAPASISRSCGWDRSYCGCCNHADRIKVAYASGYLTEDDLKSESPLLHNNLLMLGGWLHTLPETTVQNRSVDVDQFITQFNNLTWRP